MLNVHAQHLKATSVGFHGIHVNGAVQRCIVPFWAHNALTFDHHEACDVHCVHQNTQWKHLTCSNSMTATADPVGCSCCLFLTARNPSTHAWAFTHVLDMLCRNTVQHLSMHQSCIAWPSFGSSLIVLDSFLQITCTDTVCQTHVSVVHVLKPPHRGLAITHQEQFLTVCISANSPHGLLYICPTTSSLNILTSRASNFRMCLPAQRGVLYIL